MNGPFAYEYWKAAEKEIITLEGMGVWDVVEHEDDMNVWLRKQNNKFSVCKQSFFHNLMYDTI